VRLSSAGAPGLGHPAERSCGGVAHVRRTLPRPRRRRPPALDCGGAGRQPRWL